MCSQCSCSGGGSSFCAWQWSTWNPEALVGATTARILTTTGVLATAPMQCFSRVLVELFERGERENRGLWDVVSPRDSLEHYM